MTEKTEETAPDHDDRACPRLSTINLSTKIVQKSALEIARAGNTPSVAQVPELSASGCMKGNCRFWLEEHSECADVVTARAMHKLALALTSVGE